MPQRKIHSVNKVLTEEERVRHRAIREQVEQEKAELMARGRRAKARHTMLREAVAALKTVREALGLSLADIKASTADIEQPLTGRNLIKSTDLLPKQAKDFDLHHVESFNQVMDCTLHGH